MKTDKLSLRRETLRHMQPSQMDGIEGGAAQGASFAAALIIIGIAGVVTVVSYAAGCFNPAPAPAPAPGGSFHRSCPNVSCNNGC